MIPRRIQSGIGRRREVGGGIDHHFLELLTARHGRVRNIKEIMFQPPPDDGGRSTGEQRFRDAPRLKRGRLERLSRQHRRDQTGRDHKRPLTQKPRMVRRPKLAIDHRRGLDSELIVVLNHDKPRKKGPLSGAKGQNFALLGWELSGTL